VTNEGDVKSEEVEEEVGSLGQTPDLNRDRYRKRRYSKSRDVYQSTQPIDVVEPPYDEVNDIGEEIDIVNVNEDEVQNPKTPDEIAAAQLVAEQNEEFTPEPAPEMPQAGEQYDPDDIKDAARSAVDSALGAVTNGEASPSFDPEDVLQSPLGPAPEKPAEMIEAERAAEEAAKAAEEAEVAKPKEDLGFSMDSVDDF